MDSISIAEESVAVLLIHSILQYGPLSTDSDIFSDHWCPGSHQQLLKDHFIDELTSRLNHHLDDCELNWQNELVLVVIAMITMRILTISNRGKQSQVADLALKCRRTGEKWIDLISQSIQTTSTSAFAEIEELRLKIVNIGISCVLSFSIDQDQIHCLMSSNEHVISLLKAATTIHDNIILEKNQANMSTFMRTMMRVSERVLVMVQPTVAKLLQDTFYQSLNEFAAIYWAVIKQNGKLNGEWKKRIEDVYDGWYDCQYGTKRWISIDCIGGTFLVDGMTVGFLPEKITSNELFVRVFGNHIFEVQAAEVFNTYISKHAYHDNGKVYYEFHFNDQTKHLTINERHIQTKETFQLIPHRCFETELPDAFISQHSHWLNTNNRTLEFRSVNFQTASFLDNKLYILPLDTKYVSTTDTINKQVLINQSSEFFQRLFNWYFIRLDDKPYVYMMQENTSQDGTIVHIHLPRLGIAFKYSVSSNTITSREYSDMCIKEEQWFGTFTGLKSGLLLTPLRGKNQGIGNYPYRKLIVPFGKIYSVNNPNTKHQTVTIECSSMTPSLQQYFVFILNDRLRILQSTDSPTGWLYLALLHAMTSHPLPDEYTGMTGMERAFQLLKSAGCWSDQPFDAHSLNILGQIAAISPKVDYYPKHLTSMEQIDWNTSGTPYSMQHFGYYSITKRLIEASHQLSFMYPSFQVDEIPKIFQEKTYNESLLKKLYWNYRHSYNPLTRLPVEIEESIVCKSQPYQSSSEYYSHITNYNAVRLVDDLYKTGEMNLIDCSTQHWLPLSQWLNNELN
ncbi:unnamed protein product [Didymodactylos carnosus]|uniref:Uncharacterized protein n=1 Tax=Didymodactylos carnosus TaxID=1234261 RepID=A0A8S2WI19_9BILA|nr:unnamed protein product [Didymodactylos carnosus]